jgi:hypothetical protein
MVTVLRVDGLRIVIFLNDHEPAHVHVFGDGEAKIDLAAADGTPKLVWAEGMNRSEARRAMRIVIETQKELLAKWSEIHGGVD